MPRDVNLWDPQFATDEASKEKLLGLQKASRRWPLAPNSSSEVFANHVDLLPAANTTVLYADPNRPRGGHWHRAGKAITLAELLYAFRHTCTVSDIMFWYCHAPKLVKKRRHPWANADRRAAAYARREAYGHWGAQEEEVSDSAVGEKPK